MCCERELPELPLFMGKLVQGAFCAHGFEPEEDPICQAAGRGEACFGKLSLVSLLGLKANRPLLVQFFLKHGF